MKFLRQLASAIVLGVILATGIKLGNTGNIALQRGGWRPLELPDPDATADGATDG